MREKRVPWSTGAAEVAAWRSTAIACQSGDGVDAPTACTAELVASSKHLRRLVVSVKG
jgi:hypothetical protein